MSAGRGAALARRPKATVGIVSDTHGLLRPEVLAALAGSDLIVHGGDIGGPEILATLRAIAPVVAVRGNNDPATWASGLDETAELTVAGARLFVLHDANELAFDPTERGIAAIVSGHSHRPAVARRDGSAGSCLWINPGSAGPRRFALPIGVARLHVTRGVLEAELVTLG